MFTARLPKEMEEADAVTTSNSPSTLHLSTSPILPSSPTLYRPASHGCCCTDEFQKWVIIRAFGASIVPSLHGGGLARLATPRTLEKHPLSAHLSAPQLASVLAEAELWLRQSSSVTHPDLAKLVRRVMTSSESCVNAGGRMGGEGAPGDEVTSLSPVPQISPSSHPGA
ncbi:hypothetical protein E2C01_061644 [Portunus trituberculatus]|uniref:Uncharacterized protein n=1 Tax=Portunus trituberculatus TaxID=210409 RepID=A0A5B7HBT3_PORTR|nr:hypothetical protein [Portunus trituberculatus]